MGFSLKKIGKFFGKTFNLAFTGFDLVFDLVGDLFDFKIPKPPSAIKSAGKQYNVNARINEADIGGIKDVVYGRVRLWPKYCSMPYTEFEDHDQVLCAWLHITRGVASVEQVLLGDTPINVFPGFEQEVIEPLGTMGLIRPNVYTNEQVDGLELIGGLTDQDDDDGRVTIHVRGAMVFASGATTGTITADEDDFFDDFQVGDLVRINLGGANDGDDFTIVAISDNGRVLTVDPPPVSESQTDVEVFVAQRWAGPFIACPKGATCSEIAVDIVFSALFNHDGADNRHIVYFDVEYRPVDDNDNPIVPSWTTVQFTLTGNVVKPRRFTQEIALSGPMRPQVRLWRRSYEPNDPEEPASAAQWVGLKGYIDALDVDTPAQNGNVTSLAIRIRSSGLLSQGNQRAVNCFVRRELKTWSSDGWSVDGAEEQTRNPMWALADWMVRESQGRITHAMLDGARFRQLADFADGNGDSDGGDVFDGIFDREVGLSEGAKTIARVMRCVPIWDWKRGLFTIYRDELIDPSVMLCDGFNCSVGDDAIALPDADTVTGINVRFVDAALWTQRDGPLVGDDTDVRDVDFMGCTAWQKAWEEGNFEYRDLYYRGHTVSVDTEMDGLLPLHGERVLLSSTIKGWGQSGEVVEQPASQTLHVWPAPFWRTGFQHYIYLQGPDGVPGARINVTRGASDHILILSSPPDVTLRMGSGFRTLFAFGHDGDSDVMADGPRVAIVEARPSKAARSGTLGLRFEHEYVHESPGLAPDDPYEIGVFVPDLSIDNLTAQQTDLGAILDEQDGAAILDEQDGLPLLDELAELAIGIHVEWDAVPFATLYQVWWRYTDSGVQPFVLVYSGTAPSADFAVVHDGNVEIRVQAFSGSYIGDPAFTTVVVDEFAS